jgi:hypothetical protein
VFARAGGSRLSTARWRIGIDARDLLIAERTGVERVVFHFIEQLSATAACDLIATVQGVEWFFYPEGYRLRERIKQRAWFGLASRRRAGIVTFAQRMHRALRGRLISAGHARAAERSWARMAEGICEFVPSTAAANPANRGAWGKG